MDWSVSILPEADADLDAICGRNPQLRTTLENGILEEFEGIKGDRLLKLFKQGVITKSIDKLAGSEFGGSIRIQVQADYRATALCFPDYSQAYVVHVFHKSRDPKYKEAVPTHDQRVGKFVDAFHRFVSKRRK